MASWSLPILCWIECNLYETNSIKHLDLATCISRTQEIQGTTKNKELTLERGSLVLRAGDDKATCPTDSEIKVHYAFVRRGMAMQFAKLMSYNQHTQWETFLFEAMHREPPPGFSRPPLAAILQCDKAAWGRLSATVSSVRQKEDGTYPLGIALLELRSDPAIALYLMPTTKSSGGAPAASTPWRSHPYSSSGSGPRPKGTGKGKKGGKPSSPPVPSELRGKWHRSPQGEPICFGYNCRSGCAGKHIKPGQKCSKGLHICAEPRCGAEHSLQQHPGK